MNLYHVQDGDRPMWVVSEDWLDAVNRWRQKIVEENPNDDCSESQPNGITLVCEEGELLAGKSLVAELAFVRGERDMLAKQAVQLESELRYRPGDQFVENTVQGFVRGLRSQPNGVSANIVHMLKKLEFECRRLRAANAEKAKK